MSNPVSRFQIVTRNPDKAATFYSTLFDWKISADNALGYREIAMGSREGIAGGIWPAPAQASDFVQLFVSVGDLAGTVERACTLGALVVIKPTTLPDGDEMAVLRDLNGLPFAVWRRSNDGS
jgi:predicted enzyme related to lactoylglutathione lyase